MECVVTKSAPIIVVSAINVKFPTTVPRLYRFSSVPIASPKILSGKEIGSMILNWHDDKVMNAVARDCASIETDPMTVASTVVMDDTACSASVEIHGTNAVAKIGRLKLNV